MRIAIRDDAKPYQIKIICRKLGRTYDDKPLIDVLPKPPRKKS